MFENSCHVEDCRSYYFCLPRMLSSVLLLLEMVGAPRLGGVGGGWAREQAGPVGVSGARGGERFFLGAAKWGRWSYPTSILAVCAKLSTSKGIRATCVEAERGEWREQR